MQNLPELQRLQKAAPKLVERCLGLDEQLAIHAARWCDLVSDQLDQIRVVFGQYTDHGPGHCEAMLMALEWLIPPETIKKLNSLEIALLILAVYHHDIGMAWDVERYDAIVRTSTDWLSSKDLLMDRFRRSKTVTDKSDQSLLQLAFIEWARKRHADESVRWINENRVEKSDFRFNKYDPWPDVAAICKAHTQPNCDSLLTDAIRTIDGSRINLCFLACALRLADICHITVDRVDPVVERHIRFSDDYSRDKWKDKQCVVGVGGLERTIAIEAKPYSTSLHRAVVAMGRRIKDELDNANRTLSRNQSKLTFPWVHVDYETRVEATGSYRYRDWDFVLDQPKVYELLMGKALYLDESASIRELLQNAVDAIRALFGNEASNKGRIVCRRYEVERDGKAFEVIEVEDNGIGMDEDIIENHLLKVGGEPFYQTGRYHREHSAAASVMVPIAQFGIGFLSNFMVADWIEVFTRYDSPSKPADPIHIEIESFDTGVINHEPIMKRFPKALRSGSGTCVRLWLRDSLSEWGHPDRAGTWNDLKEVVTYWTRGSIPVMPSVEELGEESPPLPKTDLAPSSDVYLLHDDKYGIHGYVDFSHKHGSQENPRDIEVTVSGFYVDNTPLKKTVSGFWFPKGEIDFCGSRDFSLSVDRKSLAKHENSRTIRRARELLAGAASKWINAQTEWHDANKNKLRNVLFHNSVLDDCPEIRGKVERLTLFRVGREGEVPEYLSIRQILKQPEPVYLFLPIQPIFAQRVMKDRVIRNFSMWYKNIISDLRKRYQILHGRQKGSIQSVGGKFLFRFNARARYRQLYPLQFLIRLCDAQLEFSDDLWPLVHLLPRRDNAQTHGWEYVLSEEPGQKDWLLCSSHGDGYWVNPFSPRRTGIVEEGETVTRISIKRKRTQLVSQIADGFLHPDDIVTIVADTPNGNRTRELQVMQLGDLVHRFDRLDFWVENYCAEHDLSDLDRGKLLNVLNVDEYRASPNWSSPPRMTTPLS